MDAQELPALRTPPARLLTFQESRRSVRADKVQVFNHAHSVIFTVPPVKGFQPGATRFAASARSLPQFAASFDRAMDAARGLILIPAPASRAFPVFPLMRNAQRAIHPARRDHGFFHFPALQNHGLRGPRKGRCRPWPKGRRISPSFRPHCLYRLCLPPGKALRQAFTSSMSRGQTASAWGKSPVCQSACPRRAPAC